MQLHTLRCHFPIGFNFYQVSADTFDDKENIEIAVSKAWCVFINPKKLKPGQLYQIIAAHEYAIQHTHAAILLFTDPFTAEQKESVDTKMLHRIDLRAGMDRALRDTIEIIRKATMPCWDGMARMRSNMLNDGWYLLDMETTGADPLEHDVISLSVSFMADYKIISTETLYTVYYDSSMEYKLNAFSADSSLFYNPTTEQEFRFTKNEPICRDGLFNTRSVFSSFLILNDEDYRTIAAALADGYKAVSYMVNVENWQDTMDFQNNILKAVISDNNGVIFTNWHNSATFEKTGSQAEYLPFDGNETKIARLWPLYPLSKLSSTTTQFEAFATYLMLMLFIAIVAFVSAVMVIGLKLISTIWDDAEVYNDLRRLGMKRRKIKGLITKQMLFVYFIPTVLGCIIGAFTTYRIMLVSGVIYIGETMQLVGCVCGLVLIIQIAVFFILRSRIMRALLFF